MLGGGRGERELLSNIQMSSPGFTNTLQGESLSPKTHSPKKKEQKLSKEKKDLLPAVGIKLGLGRRFCLLPLLRYQKNYLWFPLPTPLSQARDGMYVCVCEVAVA